jgi:ABC-type Na+ efflux pump, permease component
MQRAIPQQNALRGWWRGLRESDAFQAVFSNPILVRDLRAQMRGTKSYWYQGAYLLLLGVLAVAGYAMSLQAGGAGQYVADGANYYQTSAPDIIAAQGKLETFYYFIFLTLAGLVTLIAPALTAASVTGERQRLSLDLLVTTPLSAVELLAGKLLSSVAFMGLLLALSLPASALCVLLGGATIGDVFRAYLLLAIDGVVLSAIGLFFSCAARTNLSALSWTYASVAGFLLVTMWYAPAGGSQDFSAPANGLSLAVSAALLNPFVAVLPLAGQSFLLGGLPIPLWVGAAVFAALGLRLLLTASAYRLGLHGGAGAVSLRKQGLLIAALAAFCLTFGSVMTRTNAYYGAGLNAEGIAILLIALFAGLLPFLAGLFVPAIGEDAPPGLTEAQMPDDRAAYRMRAALLPVASGALPYFHLWLGVSVAALLVGVLLTRGIGDTTLVVPLVLTVAFYVSGLGFLFWAASRLVSRLMDSLSAGRALAFGVFVLLTALPLLVIALTAQSGNWNQHPFAPLWIGYPIMHSNYEGDLMRASALTGVLSYIAGGVLGWWDARLPRRVR